MALRKDPSAAMSEQLTLTEILELARRVEGRQLATKYRRRFSVAIDNDLPVFTPVSTGYRRHPQRSEIEAFVARYNATGSLRPVDYADVTHNSSYFVALLAAAGRTRQ